MRRMLWAVLALGSGACGGGGSGGDSAPVTAPPDPTPTETFGISTRTPLASLNLPIPGSGTGTFGLTDAFPGLTFASPLYLAGVPGADRVVVVEQGGRLHAFDNDPTVTASRVVLDLSGRVLFSGEQGLLGLAFDPEFAQNRFIYVHYSVAAPARSVIARFTWEAASDLVDPASERVILEVAQPYSNHNGGSLQFGPDGYLYVAFGDGGSAGDPDNNAQNRSNPLGAILRIDVHPADLGAPYGVPNSNPFAADGDPATLGEIWAFGLRNPYRMSFDRQTGELWVGDVGQSSREEIDRIERGGNYGWSRFEGSELYNDAVTLAAGTTAIGPVYEYGRDEGIAIIGGYVYRGSAIAPLFGRYVYTDFGSGRVWALDRDDATVASNELLAVADQPTSLGEDNDAELYVVSRAGSILTLEETSGAPSLPATLSATGVFTDLSALTPAPGLIEYDLNVPFWSDGAVKRRWIGLPGSTTIGFAAGGNWSFPVGTVLVKHFEMALDESRPGTRRRLETRILINDGATWQGFTYRWNSVGSEAQLLAGRETEVLTIRDPAGVERDQLYTYPSRSDCLQCHTAAAGRALGVRTRQLNREFGFPEALDNQLHTWNHIALFDRDIGAAAQYGALPALADSDAPIADRARAWLDVNCSQCHQPDGPTGLSLDLRADVATAAMNAVGVTPTVGDLGIADAAIIMPGSREQSVLWERIRRLDGFRMPPLASHRVDDEGAELVGQWIDAL